MAERIIERTIEIGIGKIKKFYCNTKDLCSYKQEWINQRCFAPYTIRASCRYLADKKQAEQLAKE